MRIFGAIIVFLIYFVSPSIVVIYNIDKFTLKNGFRSLLGILFILLNPIYLVLVSIYVPIKYNQFFYTNQKYIDITIALSIVAAFVYYIFHSIYFKIRKKELPIVENILIFLGIFIIYAEIGILMALGLFTEKLKIDQIYKTSIEFTIKSERIMICLFSAIISIVIIYFILKAIIENNLHNESKLYKIFPIGSVNSISGKLKYYAYMSFITIFHYACVYFSYHLIDLAHSSIDLDIGKYFLQNYPVGFSGKNLFSDFFSYLYFSMVTFFTVGFGDVTPASAYTRMIVVFEMVSTFIIVVLGVSLFIGGNNFSEHSKDKKDQFIKGLTDFIETEKLDYSNIDIKYIKAALLHNEAGNMQKNEIFINEFNRVSKKIEDSFLQIDNIQKVSLSLNQRLNKIEALTSLILDKLGNSILEPTELKRENLEYLNTSKKLYIENINYFHDDKNKRESLNVQKNRISETFELIDQIDKIAEGINILTINVSIEASRTEKSNNGFSVISKELEVFSNDIKKYVMNIKNLLVNINEYILDLDEKFKGIECFSTNNLKNYEKEVIIMNKVALHLESNNTILNEAMKTFDKINSLATIKVYEDDNKSSRRNLK